MGLWRRPAGLGVIVTLEPGWWANCVALAVDDG